MESHEVEAHQDATLTTQSKLTTARIQGLSDGIFGFAMTLLALDLQVGDVNVAHGYLPALFALAPHLIPYILSFVALGVLWIAQHNQYYWVEYVDRTFLWINLFYLMTITLIPFSTKVLAANLHSQGGVEWYGANLIISGIILLAMWTYATEGHRLIAANVSHEVINRFRSRILFTLSLNILALAVSYRSPTLGLALFVISQFSGIIPALSIDQFITAEERVKQKVRENRK